LKRWGGYLAMFFLFFGTFSLRADYYDTSLLTIFSKLLPRIVALSSLAPTEGEVLGVCIVHQDIDAPAAEQFEKLLKRAVKAHRVESIQTDFEHITVCRHYRLVFLFDAPPSSVSKALSELTAPQPLVAAYDTHMLSQGADISLFVGRSVKPYLNLHSIKAKKIRFDPLLLRVSKVYDSGGMQ
jgi:hypothetical protein